MQFNHYNPVGVVFGDGAVSALANHIKSDNILILLDPFMASTNLVDIIRDNLKGKSIEFFSDIEPNPSQATVDNATEAGRGINARTVVGIG